MPIESRPTPAPQTLGGRAADRRNSDLIKFVRDDGALAYCRPESISVVICNPEGTVVTVHTIGDDLDVMTPPNAIRFELAG